MIKNSWRRINFLILDVTSLKIYGKKSPDVPAGGYMKKRKKQLGQTTSVRLGINLSSE
jgi:hypothetical protein